MDRGLFITFEGIDGCGKSTQIGLLPDWLAKRRADFVLVREPGGTPVGEKIRTILLDKENDGMSTVAELLLFEAARAQIVSERIRPALCEGRYVICDRFFDSTYAYQGVARNLGTDLVNGLNRMAAGGLEPDLTFFLDISVDESFKRRRSRAIEDDRIELLGRDFQNKVRGVYLEAAKASQRIKTVDASGTPEEIFNIIKGYITERE